MRLEEEILREISISYICIKFYYNKEEEWKWKKKISKKEEEKKTKADISYKRKNGMHKQKLDAEIEIWACVLCMQKTIDFIPKKL